eukprot:TRINITY_DN25038_c0_g1_i1.p2 TRINITY_DN25038_c0_g1~~TRINITY_DN25038_c0_g1_i1.p2  ORF type:complete len:125 (-),score=19.99 TRINITY_DN25038_c0_g1_i1:893-1219(-)
MSKPQGTVHQLLKAEKEAAEMIEAAKRKRAQRIREARTEAEAEVQGLRAKYQKNFERLKQESEASGDQGSTAMAAEAEKELAQIKNNFRNNSEKMTKEIVQLVSQPSL